MRCAPVPTEEEKAAAVPSTPVLLAPRGAAPFCSTPTAARSLGSIGGGATTMGTFGGSTFGGADASADGATDEGRRLAWWLVMSSLPADEALLTLPLVSKGFRDLAIDSVALASTLASMLGCHKDEGTVPLRDKEEVTKAFPSGRFLAAGGYKRVYAVLNEAQRRWEAMSVLDIKQLRTDGLSEALAKELWISLMLSQLRRRGRCPHFLHLHQCFQSSMPPPEDEWGAPASRAIPPTPKKIPPTPARLATETDSESEDDGCPATPVPSRARRPKQTPKKMTPMATRAPMTARKPPPTAARAPPGTARRRKPAATSRKPRQVHAYQYVLSELATGGDMEEACKLQPGEAWETAMLPTLLFQMLFSVHVAQKELMLRHYDIKLLNFFLTQPPAPRRALRGTDVRMRYAAGKSEYEITLRAGENTLAMLADFGTADVDEETLGAAVGVAQYTTLENTPPELLLGGAAAAQSYACDAFGLGLCVVHLLTGEAPYEELLDELHCPPDLAAALDGAWRGGGDGKESVYHAMVRLLDDDENNVLPDTLYRLLIMLGPSLAPAADADGAVDGGGVVGASAAWAAVRKWAKSSAGGKRYAKDRKQWSLLDGGKAEAIERARARMGELPGCEALLRGLTHFDPERRWGVEEAIASDFFAPLRAAAAGPPPPLAFLHYREAGSAAN